MAGPGKPGRAPGGPKFGGRRPGSPNKVTREARLVFKEMFDRLAPEAEEWIRASAQVDPGKAAQLLLALAEFHLPKLSRAEITIRQYSLEELAGEVARREAELLAAPKEIAQA